MQPLRRFHFASYTAPDKYRGYLAAKVGKRFVEFPNGTRDFRCSVNLVATQQLSLFAFGHRSDVVILNPGEDFHRYQICRAGAVDITAGERQVQLRPGQSCVVTANLGTEMRYGANSEHIVLRFTSASLHAKLQAMLGASPAREIRFDELSVETSETSGLRTMAMQLVAELDAHGRTNSIAATELENVVTTMFLLDTRHNYSGALASQPKSSAPFQVRLAEEYMEANWDQPITIETLTETTGVSARSLFERFQSYRGITPIAFLRQVRLRNARRMLMSPKPDTTVTGVALACGFLNTGHFARHYREAFGELPSKVLAASRSLIVGLAGLYAGAAAHGWLDVKARMVERLTL